ncbi:uncharacterized protein SPPG_02744 [Spizellomyces punctatus DAOM BR117]|uniref:RRM domain-containing protein n=1 Tax=Spizellomyces punctatus (strain DAOM BR117) TaxID=645134 RepID=A0A0L0HLF6_SPIPD|nr:uncharacterized protein SPPG_02744 [Spizellomyces punctatus DAOM BR117]KND02266.1 hypothetical protein SPPG_02744 [Spizellomyces punctatus DAOM BR117]|eukprot:XP_016610305.1 hypothetical protein SPPG_02744 [Spizellomyces punctatus DAOM BR117]
MWFAKTYSAVQAGSIDGTDTTPHDHGIARAEKAHYKKPSADANLTKDPFKTLFVGRLGTETIESALERAFERFGKILSVRIVRHVVTGKSRGYGFVEYDRERDCMEAYKRMNKSLIDGHAILVDYERARVMEGWTPRRLGGGFGGRKESGQLRFGARDRPFKPPIYGHRGEHQAVPDIAFDQRYDDCWREHARRAATAGNQEASTKEPLRRSKSGDHVSQHRASYRQNAAYQPSSMEAAAAASRHGAEEGTSRARHKSHHENYDRQISRSGDARHYRSPAPRSQRDHPGDRQRRSYSRHDSRSPDHRSSRDRSSSSQRRDRAFSRREPR